MPDESGFFTAFNFGNVDFAKDAWEYFTVETKRGEQRGTPGRYRASCIDDLASDEVGMKGGTEKNNQVHIYITKVLKAEIGLSEDAVISARGYKTRVASFQDSGDSEIMVICEKFGVTANQ